MRWSLVSIQGKNNNDQQKNRSIFIRHEMMLVSWFLLAFILSCNWFSWRTFCRNQGETILCMQRFTLGYFVSDLYLLINGWLQRKSSISLSFSFCFKEKWNWSIEMESTATVAPHITWCNSHSGECEMALLKLALILKLLPNIGTKDEPSRKEQCRWFWYILTNNESLLAHTVTM